MRWWLVTVLALAACRGSKGEGSLGNGITAETHSFFPIDKGTRHEVTAVAQCESCHPSTTDSFQDFTCIGCHEHAASVTDPLHSGVAGYRHGDQTCFGCHPNGEKAGFNHVNITVSCASCHGEGNRFAALPKMGFTHPPQGSSDCAACHNTMAWTGATFNHAGVTDSCTSCHAEGKPFATLPKTGFTHPPQGTSDCGACHSTTAWTGAKFNHAGVTDGCATCHAEGKTYAALPKAGLVHMAIGNTDCSACHTSDTWKGATSAHAGSGTTAQSTLDCNMCHGPAGTAKTHLAVTTANHYQGVANGNACKSCHIDFSAFKGTIANVKYAHTNAQANANGCQGCHSFSGGLYTTLTTTPVLNQPTVSGGHQFSQSRSVTGRRNNDVGPPAGSFTSTHQNTELQRCSSCHRYSATTATANVWAWQHEPSSPGISANRQTTGCTICH